MRTITVRTRYFFRLAGCTAAMVAFAVACDLSADETAKPASSSAAVLEQTFQQQIQPLIQEFCFDCHNADEMKSGVRVDQLTSTPTDRQLFLWQAILEQISDGKMPPKDEAQPSPEQRKLLTDWIPQVMSAAMARNTQKNGSTRRLTVAQYRNTLRDLLLLDEDLTEALPPDAASKEGFTNHNQTMLLSPLQVEAYFQIAEQAVDLCLVDEAGAPSIQNFRMDLGTSINPAPCPDQLVLGALSMLLNNQDFQVTELVPEKPFPVKPYHMQTKFEFIEGYVGNDTIREWKKFDSIYHAVFACVRGTPGYPKGEPYQLIPEGILLRPAIPSPEIFGQSNTYGPMANFKISLRELPDRGNFRVTLNAARYDDALLLDADSAIQPVSETSPPVIAEISTAAETTVTIPAAGIYQLDVAFTSGDSLGLVTIGLGDRTFAKKIEFEKPANSAMDNPQQTSAFLLIRLPAGELKVAAKTAQQTRLRHLILSAVLPESEPGQRFLAFERRVPSMGVHVGLRRDCGSTLAQVGEPQAVASREFQNYVFSGPINDFPSPDVEPNNVNYLAGIREIGVRCEYTDGRDTPRLLIRSIEFEGPYYDTWPPTTHRNIFLNSVHRDEPDVYAREILTSFATRAFRRPVTTEEQAAFFSVWEDAYAEKHDFSQSIRDTLLVILTSPQFLFLIENSHTPEPEDLEDFELASKLSFFLWNTMPDLRLLELAGQHRLRQELDHEITRMIQDDRFEQFIREFASQWMSLDKFDVVSVDMKRYPTLTRDTKQQLRHEPEQFLQYLLRENLSVRNLIQSDFLVANEVVASYYGLGNRTESGFQFLPVRHENENLGGLLTQAGILSGLSDGRESNPVKRGAWLARKIIAEPPADPPPNVPKLPDDEGSQLTLRQKLERHRNQEGCAKCHSGIDPWGLPLEWYDAGGLIKKGETVDAHSRLPDGTEVADAVALKRYLAEERLDQVTFSFLKHLATYAVGRSLTYNELVFLHTEGVKFGSQHDGLQDLLRFVIHSDIFLKK